MRLRLRVKISFLLLAACLAAFSLSCKKEEEETTKSYLDGYLTVGGVPAYCNGGDTVSISLKGVSYPSSETDTTYTLGMYYTVSSVQTTSDTVFNAQTNPYKSSGCGFTYVIPDTLGTFTMLFSVYPSASDKYYTNSMSATFVVVDDMLTIPEISPYALSGQPEIYTDARDSSKYAVVVAGGKKWLNRNLAYCGTKENPAGVAYAGAECMNYVFGRFYNWSEAQTACPEGWRLPSSAEWDLLGNVSGDLMVDAYFNTDTRLWEYWPDVRITNRYQMGFIPAGYCNNVSRYFSGTLEYAAFWTSDRQEVEQSGKKTQLGVYRYVYMRDGDFKRGLLDPDSESMPIRCVKD